MFWTIVTLPTNFISDINTQMSALITDMAPYLVWIIGIIGAMIIISFLIGILHRA